LKKIIQHIKQWLKALLYALLTVVIIKAFFFWVYIIPSSSMEKTLLPGDLIFVNKTSYGIRMPITPLTIPLTHQKMPFFKQLPSYWDLIQLPYYRIFSSTIKRNDVVVFNYPLQDDIPIDHRAFYIKRCIGLPGDTLKIRNKKVYINSTFIPFPKNVEFNYRVETDNSIDYDSLATYNITEGSFFGNGFWELTLSDSVKNKISQLNQFKLIKPIKVDTTTFANYIFPYEKYYCWNIDYFGPLVIPQKGTTVQLDSNNIYIYQYIIDVYEENELKWDRNIFVINGDTTSKYTFKMDYYFMMGDNRHNSSDSRFFGFVPEDHVVGKAISVLISANKAPSATQKYRWERFFKRIE